MSLLAEDGAPIAVRTALQDLKQWCDQGGFPVDYLSIKSDGFNGKPRRLKPIEPRLREDSIERMKFFELTRLYPGERDFSQPAVSVGVSRRRMALDVCISQQLWSGTPEECCNLAKRIFPSIPFVYGYCYALPESLGPSWYASGAVYLGEAFLPKPEHEHKMKGRWSKIACFPNEHRRADKIRQVYRLQFLSKSHLELPIDGMPLRKWIKGSRSHGELKVLLSGIWSWTLPDLEAVNRANLALHAAGLLWAWEPELAGPVYW